MLVLTRKAGDSTFLRLNGAEITVKIVKVVNGRVHLGIDAPQSVDITRDNARNTEKANGR